MTLQVFRQVDRADFMTFPEEESDILEAYEDHAWRMGTLHLSAPCIYTRAMEALTLKPGEGEGGYLNMLSGSVFCLHQVCLPWDQQFFPL